LFRLKLSAGVVVAVATEVVKIGDRFPALKVVTVPEPPPPEYCGIFSVFPTRVEAPLEPVVVRVRLPCLLFSCVCTELVGSRYDMVVGVTPFTVTPVMEPVVEEAAIEVEPRTIGKPLEPPPLEPLHEFVFTL